MKQPIVAVTCIVFLTGLVSTMVAPADVLASAPITGPRRILAETTLPSSLPAADKEQILLDFCVYRVSGDVSGETSLAEIRSDRIEVHGQGTKQKALIFFMSANLTVAGVELRASESGWTWNGKDRPPNDKRVQVISRPRLIVLASEPNNSFKVSIQSKEPIEYFEKRPDGLFELKKTDEETGLSISAAVAGGPEQIVLRDLTIGLRSIEGREPIAGVSLDVGRPIVKAQESVSTITVKTGRDYGLWLHTEGYGALLIRLRATRVNPRTMNEPDVAPGL